MDLIGEMGQRDMDTPPLRRANVYELTVFGASVLRLMEQHGVKTQAELRRRILNTTGVDLVQQRVSAWLYGKAAVDKQFPAWLSKALDLTEDERLELAVAFAYGQR